MKQRIRFFCLALVALVAGMAAAQNVAKVGTTEYATIEEAIEAWGPGKTLTLLDNVTTTSTVIVEVNATKSTQNWTLDLGDYTWTANGCNAIQLYAAGGTVMNQNYGLKVNANENGGIKASGKYCIEAKYDNAKTRYRPRLEIHGGTYEGSYIIYYYSSSWSNSNIENGPSTHIFKSNDGTEPIFNGNFGMYKCPLTINAGYFNGTSFNTYPVGSTADTYLKGGHFKTISAFPSASNNKGIIFGNYKVFVKSDASIDVVNGAPAEYEAKATKTLLLSSNQGVNYSDYIYYEKVNDAIQNSITNTNNNTIEIVLAPSVTATQDKTISRSGTLTIDATAEGSSYTGNVVLANNSAKLVMIFPEGEGHYGVSVNSGTLHVVETVADGIVTRTYSRVSTISNPEAKVGSTNYSTVYDAFYAIDGTTDNKTIVLQRDVTNAGIVTNGTATGGDGKTVATFDLNGKSIGIGSVAAGNNADYTLTIIDSSQDKTGTVTNSDASLFILALTGINDYSGTYTLKIQAGTWLFDPSNVVINGETHNLVDEGYVAKDNGNGTWTVGEIPSVAKIGDTKYRTIDAAVAAAAEGQTVEVIMAGEYTLPGLPKNITIEGTVDGIVFNHTSSGNVASIPNGATFKNVAFNFGNVNYHGFQHAGTINMEGCTLNGKLFSYGDMNFTNCSFNQSNSDYHMWTYSGNVTYTDCTFTNSETGKFLNVYNESGATKYTVTVNNCKFVNNASAANKAAINVKATSGSNLLAYDVIINNCTTEGAFPEANWGDALVVLNPVVQVDDRTASGVDNITVTQDGVLIYPVTVAAIGETKYPTLQAALDAAHEMTGDVTVELLDNISGYSIVHQKDGLNLTIDGKEKTLNGQIIIDGDGRAAGTETLTVQNIKFYGDLSNFYTGTDAFILVPSTKDANTPYTTGKYNYAHNITITDCSFNSTADAFKAVAFKSNSGAGCYNLVMSSVTGDNLHSLAQLTGTTGATFDNCSATLTGSFIGANGGDGTYTVSNCTFESHPDKADGYAYREKSGSTAVATLTNNNFKAHDAIILGSAGTINVESGTYVGEVSKTAGTIAISGGKFSAPIGDAEYAGYFAEGLCGVNGLYEGDAPNGVGTAVASITTDETTIKFATFEAAVDAATSGETIELLANITDAYTMSEGQTLKVKKNGFSVTIKAPEGFVLISSTPVDGVITYTIVEPDLMYTDANGTVSYKAWSNTVISTNGTYKLLKDVTASARIVPGMMISNVTLDLNGFTLTSTATDAAFYFSRAGTAASPKVFNIVNTSENGDGKVVVNPEADKAIEINGNYNNVTIGEGVTIDGGCVAVLKNNDILTVEGTVNGGDDFAIVTNGGTTTNATITIKNGAVLTSNSVAMYLPGTGTTTIEEGAKVTGTTGIYVKSATLNIEGGEITGNGPAAEYAYNNNGCNSTGQALVVDNCNYPGGAPIVNITGGKFTTANNESAIGSYAYGDGAEAIGEFVHGGYFSTELPRELCEAGKKTVPSTTVEGYYELGEVVFVAQIGDTKYESLAAAVAAVLADGTETTITMIANEMINVSGYAITIPATKNVVIDLNGFQVVGTSEGGSTSALITNQGILTIKDSSDTNADGSGTGKLISGASTTWTWDGTDDYTGSYASNLIRNEKNLIVESGYLYNMSTGSAAYAIDNYSAGNVTINGGKVDAAKASAIRMFYVNGGSITVNDGIIGHYNSDDDCTYCGIQVMSGTNVNVSVNGGTIVGNYAVYANNTGGNINISGGTYDGYVGFAASVPNIEITGGAFNYWVGTWGEQTKFISGGIYAEEVDEEYIADGYILTDNTDPATKDVYPFAVRQANYICAIGTTKYETLAEAVAAAGTAETTITLLTEAATDGVISGDGVVVPSGSNITFDLNGLTYDVSGETVGSSGTENQGFQLLQGSNITFKNGTLKATSPTAQMLIQNYSNLTLEDVNLDGTTLSGWAYALSNNCGTINLTGSTSITAKSGGRAFDTCKFGSYAIPTVNINTTGVIFGPIEATGGKLNIENGKFDVTWVTDSHYAAGDIQIKGGVFTAEVAEEYCAEGFVCTDNDDPTYKYTVKTKEEAGIFELKDTDESYPYPDGIAANKVTYTRSFSSSQKDKHQPWFVPFDYTVTEDDKDNFTFYKIHMIAASGNTQGDEIHNNELVYIYIEPVEVGTVLKGNRPYLVKPKEEMTDHVFVADNITELYAKDTSSRLHQETTEFEYDFYGQYNKTKWVEKNQVLFMSGGKIVWNSGNNNMGTYRWYIKATAKDNDGYAKPVFQFVEGDGSTTDILSAEISDDSVEGIYTVNGAKVEHPVKGVNIIRYTNGSTKKIFIK